MDYFKLSVNPGNTILDYIVVDNFHPKWRDVVKLLDCLNIECRILKHINEVNHDSRLAITVNFTPECGLSRIEFEGNKGMYLDEVLSRYYSRNIMSSDHDEVHLIVSTMEEYMRYMHAATEAFLEN